MKTIDELGARAAASARAEAAEIAATRVEAGLERLRLEGGPIVVARRTPADPRRWLAIGIAAALTAAAVTALVVNANESDGQRLVPATTPTQPMPAPTSAATTIPPDTTGLDQSAPDTTPALVFAESIAVSHDSLPPPFAATAFVGMTDQTRVPFVAIGDTRIVVVDADTSAVVLIDPFDPTSVPQPVQLDVKPTGMIAAGPGDVLYAVVQGDGANMSLDAIALSGARTGQVLVSASVASVEFVEAPLDVLGHGAQGIIDRRTGQTLLSYVDAKGVATSLGRPSHEVVADNDIASGDLTVSDPAGTHDWHLTIDRDPTSPLPNDGEVLPLPSSHGGVVVSTAVGPPVDPSADVPTPSEPVVAVLAADGTGTWYSLADGWQVGASDLDGTVLVRLTGGTVELARLDPPQRFDFVDQPAVAHERVAFAQTLQSALTSADPCTTEDLAVVPTQEGAAGTTYGILNVRNKGEKPCEISGVPDVALLDESGHVVQSTDPGLVGQSQDAPLILVRDSWATSVLGPVANTVCGGNESSQLVLTIDGASTSVPFAVGRAIEPGQCAASEIHPAVPGELAVQGFAPVQPPATPIGLPPSLGVTIEAPSTVRAGDVLRYDVVFSSESESAVIDDSICPIYVEKLRSASAQLMLNCNGGEGILINAGEEVRFHIELPVPADAVLGPATLLWAPIEPNHASAIADITIVA